jgi:hypothetical protein
MSDPVPELPGTNPNSYFTGKTYFFDLKWEECPPTRRPHRGRRTVRARSTRMISCRSTNRQRRRTPTIPPRMSLPLRPKGKETLAVGAAAP